MRLGPITTISPKFLAIAGLSLVALLAWGVFNLSQSLPGNAASGPETGVSSGSNPEAGSPSTDSQGSDSTSGPTLGPAPTLEANSQIPAPVASAQNQDQQAQTDAQIAEEEKAAAQQQQNRQLEQAPMQFACQVTGIRFGQNRSLLRINVSAPSDIPEVWVSVETERGDQDGKIQLSSGSGEQVVQLRNPTNGFRPTIKVYSLPILTEQYEMCSYR